MAPETKADGIELEKEVKEFGNAGHVTLPGEFVGETVQITPVEGDSDQPQQIHPPITEDKLQAVFVNSTRSDFKKISRDSDTFPRECQFQYRHDIRLTVNVDLVHEGSVHPYHERGTIVYFIREPTADELDEHKEGFDKSEDEVHSELIYALDPSVEDIFDHPLVGYNDLYEYTVCWNGSPVYSVEFNNRGAKNGRFYYPRWGGYESLSDYRSTTAYDLATALSEAPQSEYDQYLDALQLDETVWGDKSTPLEFDREHVLENMPLFMP